MLSELGNDNDMMSPCVMLPIWWSCIVVVHRGIPRSRGHLAHDHDDGCSRPPTDNHIRSALFVNQPKIKYIRG